MRRRTQAPYEVSGVNKKNPGDRKAPFSAQRQILLLQKSVKKAKQFELRKLIRRLKATKGRETSGLAASTQKLQDKHDITKGVSCEALLQQAVAECGLVQPGHIQDAAANNSEGAQSQHTMTQLICGKILSARCVQEQIKLIKEWQLQGKSSADPDVKQTLRGKQTDALDEKMALIHANQAGSNGDREVCDPTSGAATVADACNPASTADQQQLDKAPAGAASTSCPSIRKSRTQPLSYSVGHVSDAFSGKRGSDDTSISQQPQIELQPFPTPEEAPQMVEGNLPSQSQDAEAQPTGKKEAFKKMYLQGQHKISKKRNRLGQRARQQLGRKKQARLCHNESKAVPVRKQGFAGSPGRLEQNPNAFGQEKSSKGHQVEKLSAANVHPSWVAKRKQKRAFLAASSVCQKCVFGDDDRPVMSVQAPAVAARVLKSSKPASLPAEDLHPSWLAKRAAAFQQAQVPNITSQSKIRFED